MDYKSLIEETEKKLTENARQIDQICIMRENLIAQGNKLVGRLEMLKELEKEDSNEEENQNKNGQTP